MKKIIHKIDWWIIFSIMPLLVLSLSAINSFGFENGLFLRQFIWIIIALIVFFIPVTVDLSFINKSKNIIFFYGFGLALLIFLVFFGITANGATSWISFGGFTFQPADFMKLMLILILAKYLARRHVEIKAVKHIIVTGLYFFIPFLLIFLQPDFGSAIILFGIWFGMIMVSGISKKHLLVLMFIAGVSFSFMWAFVLQDYQKERIKNFIHPLSDIRGTGYNAYQSTIAVGSGELFGKGVGYGTQSRLSFLPEYETDFIFAAISEEWGFVGSALIILLLFFIVIRILVVAYKMNSNFELLFSVGVAFYFMSHIAINIGMNIGIMPVTGVTLPFVSYGGSHLVVEFLALGMIMGMRGRNRIIYKDGQADAFLQ
jgi:rod shape determining protein RodA